MQRLRIKGGGNDTRRSCYSCSTAEDATRASWERSTITELRTTAKKTSKAIKKCYCNQQQDWPVQLKCSQGATFEGQLQMEVTVRFPAGACLLLRGWFTYQSANLPEKSFCSPQFAALEKGIVSALFVQTTTKRKEERKMKGTTIMESNRKGRQDPWAGRAFGTREGENEGKNPQYCGL